MVHLEVASDLSTPAILVALKRFTSRRGLPTLIRSDCGTNHVCHNLDIRSSFVFALGRIFKAAVKFAKTYLQQVVREEKVTFDEFSTVFCQIEVVLNSRPLCPLSNELKDLADFWLFSDLPATKCGSGISIL
ncbi:hypothetical protein EVAR_68153_1 [Eumeta japonica]|uniref:Uncharacterized protein n=1 Tax=Eumeta variegata TaxID=151549 RepID=A0A4C1SPN7_EUMVA|nr:hypothetical protein EVAR_68153_1 [Eumeta japonica]